MEIEIPKNCNVALEGDAIRVTAGSEVHTFKFNSRKLRVSLDGTKLKAEPIKKIRRETGATIKTMLMLIRNLFDGNSKLYERKLQVIYAHFPVSIEQKGRAIQIKNFLGEKVPRHAEIVGSTQVQTTGQEIIVRGTDKSAVGQTAANIVQAVRIVGKDRRVFQDGIYLVK